MTKGTRIRHLRESLGLSQIDVANAVKVSKQTLYKYENDIVTNIPSEKVEDLAYVLNTTPAYIMGWTDDPTIREIPHLEDLRVATVESRLFPKGSVTVSVEKPSITSKEDKEAKRLYDLYLQAPPEIQAAIETMLKYQSHDS